MRNQINCIIRPGFIFLAFVLLMNNGLSQSCPAVVGEYKLITAGSSNVKKIYNNRGIKFGELTAWYDIPGQNAMVIQLTWIEEDLRQNPDFEKLTNTCFSLSSPALFNSKTKQVAVSIGNYTNEHQRQLLATLALDLIKQAEPLAIPCPGTRLKDDIEFGDYDGAFKAISGDVWIVTPDGRKSKASDGTALYRGCKIITAKNALARIEIKSKVNDNEMYIPENEKGVLIMDISGNSEIDMRELLAAENLTQDIQDQNQKKRTVFEMIKGAFHWLTRNWKKNTSGIILQQYESPIWIRGTDFIASYSALNKSAEIYLNNGELEFKDKRTGQIKRLLSGQTITFQNGNFSEPAYMSPANWEEQLAISGFSNLDQRENTNRKETNRYKIRFEGQQYSTFLDKKQQFEGKPIDVYYYEFYGANGIQVEQDHQKLYNRFVRVPAADYFDQSGVVWWYIIWKREGNRWVIKENKGVKAELME